jgi:hypothetical protein
MNAVSMAEKRPARAQTSQRGRLDADTDTHEDEKTVDVLAVFLQQDLVLFLKPGFCTSPLRGQLAECSTLARIA